MTVDSASSNISSLTFLQGKRSVPSERSLRSWLLAVRKTKFQKFTSAIEKGVAFSSCWIKYSPKKNSRTWLQRKT